ncbi:MAG TPA: VOC family protein [Planctomycetota bacterium]|nr:VOC family protein [Planctomycetota bacterium]
MSKPEGAPKGQKTSMIQAPIMTQVNYFVHYVPKDKWKQAVEFFETTIGLMLRMDTGHGWAEFNAGGITFALHEGEHLIPKDTGLCFAVDDCDHAAAALRNRNVQGVTEPRKVSEEPEAGRCFEFKDPFGNTFSAYGK